MRIILTGDPRRANNLSVGTEMVAPLWPEVPAATSVEIRREEPRADS